KKYFDLIVTGDDVESHKPSAEGIFKFLKLFKLDADEVLMIGDSVHDIIAAKEAKVQIASAVWDSYSKSKVIEMNPNCYFESVNELKEWLKEKI
ncbi:MAG: HAD-IA family hydrolase, partial [Ignavibacteria bacterium]|nr:HAD-IA family hydrolase [Ignavibacteria bacterium]